MGISNCYRGERVRYDGGHKHSRLCTEGLSRYFEFVPVCPEVGIGMSIPRKPIRLIGEITAPQAVTVADIDQNFTTKLTRYGQQKSIEMTALSGYIFMKDSPS